MMRVGMESLIATVSGAAVRRRRWFVAAWIVLLLVALPFSGKAQGMLSSGGFDVPGERRVAKDPGLGERGHVTAQAGVCGEPLARTRDDADVGMAQRSQMGSHLPSA